MLPAKLKYIESSINSLPRGTDQQTTDLEIAAERKSTLRVSPAEGAVGDTYI
jgi:hypothetical protein